MRGQACNVCVRGVVCLSHAPIPCLWSSFPCFVCVLGESASRAEIPFPSLVVHPRLPVIVCQVWSGVAGLGQSYVRGYLLNKWHGCGDSSAWIMADMSYTMLLPPGKERGSRAGYLMSWYHSCRIMPIYIYILGQYFW